MKTKIIALLICLLLLSGCSSTNAHKNYNKESRDQKVNGETFEDATGDGPGTDSTIENDTTKNEKSKPTSSKDYSEIYKSVLKDDYNFIRSCEPGKSDYESYAKDGQKGIASILEYSTSEETKSSFGYTIQDINDDGIPELIITSEYTGGIIELYTCKNNRPITVLEGYVRDSFQITNDYKICEHGSSGAAYSTIAFYNFPKGGTRLECEDYYFTEPDDNDYSITHYYHNTTGSNSKSDSKEISENEFQKGTAAWGESLIEFKNCKPLTDLSE